MSLQEKVRQSGAGETPQNQAVHVLDGHTVEMRLPKMTAGTAAGRKAGRQAPVQRTEETRSQHVTTGQTKVMHA